MRRYEYKGEEVGEGGGGGGGKKPLILFLQAKL